MRNFLTPILFSIALVLAAGTAQAQSRMQLAQQYVELPAVQQMMREMFSPDTMYQQISASMPTRAKISNAKKRRIGNVMSQAMVQTLPAFNKIMIRESARAFSKPELKAMIAFYSSPEGASILSKTTTMMNRSMRSLAPHMQAVEKAVTPAIIKILKD